MGTNRLKRILSLSIFTLLAFTSSCDVAMAYHPDPLNIIYGGTSAATRQTAINNLAGNVTNASFLRGNGTNILLGPIQASDVPTLNQNTTGTAANITATSNSTLTTLSALATASSLTTIGTIGSGTWQGGIISRAFGGTSNTSWTTNGTVYASASALLSTATGSASQTLTSNGSGSPPTYQFPAVTAQTTTYAVLTTDSTILASGSAFTITLPTAIGVTGKQYTIKKTDASLSNQITIATTSSQTIDGVTTRKVSTQFEQFTVVSDGANWNVVSHTYPSAWVAYTPTLTGFGTVTGTAFLSRRVGDSLEIQGTFTTGTTAGVAATVTLGYGGTNANVTTDATVISASLVGVAGYGTVNTVLFDGGILATPSSGTLAFSRASSTTSILSAAQGSAVNGNTQPTAMNALVKISGWEG